MTNIEQHDNTIEWLFEKIFDQITINSSEIYLTPFVAIFNKTFGSNYVYDLISELNGKNKNIVQKYLLNSQFQEKFLFTKLWKK